MRYIAFDTETGGLSPAKTDILTAYFCILDDDLQLQAELELKIRPNGDDPYRVTAGALSINGIDLIKHHKEALTKTEAAFKLKAFLNNYKPPGKEKLIPVGHNLSFDVNFICEHLLTKQEWDAFCGYKKVDTLDVAYLLTTCKRISPKGLGLETLVEYFNLPKTQAHNAKNDTLMTIMILREMKKLIS